MAIDWGDVPTWGATIGTVSAVAVALWQIRAQRSEQRKRDHRAQAELLSVWYAGESDRGATLTVLNGSTQPVHAAVATLTINGRPGEGVPDDYRAVMPILPPGRWLVDVAGGWAGMSAYPTAELGFTDHRGDKHWIRRPNGALEQMARSAIEHYDIYLPFSLAQLRPME